MCGEGGDVKVSSILYVRTAAGDGFAVAMEDFFTTIADVFF